MSPEAALRSAILAPVASPSTGPLLALARSLERARDLDEMLDILVARTATLLHVERVSVRVLDETGEHLLVGARTGAPLHTDAKMQFVMGEGLVGWVARHAEPLRLGRADEDPRFVVREGMVQRMQSFLGVPLVVADVCIGVVAAVSSEADAFSEEDEHLLLLASALCAPHVQIARLRELSRVDPLTGVLNRRGLDTWEAPPNTSSVSIATVDLDHFKEVNDRFGHSVGDDVLRTVAALLGGVLRRGDVVVRLGGEEFLLVLPGVGLDDATSVAERARRAIESHVFAAADDRFGVTASIGVASGAHHDLRRALVERADAAMYAAKRRGRNRVERAA
jgi:diguanylate cyclase (GGDEF)-like protein